MTLISSIIKLGILACSFGLGVVGYRLLADWPVTVRVAASLHNLWQLGYARIGIVLIPLVALTGCLIYLVLGMAATRDRSLDRRLQFIAEAGPMLGVLGTMIALAQAMASFNVSGGLQDAIRQMTARMGQALLSSIVGITVALGAYAVRHLIASREG
jgi:hypothetical protein